MFGVAEYAVRILVRYGALVSAVALTALLIVAVIAFARSGFRAPLWGLCALISVVGLVALSGPASESISAFSRAWVARTHGPPTPSGQFAVGNSTIALAPLRGEGAPIEVRVWYPRDAGDAQRRFILYTPGIGGDRDQTSYLIADLASHGYVVLAYDDLSQDPAPANETPEARALREGLMSFATHQELADTVARSDARVEIQSTKAIDIINRFAAIAQNPSSPWGGQVDMERIGALGFSFGGSTAAEAALLDPRIVAVANIDGTLFGRARQEQLTIPNLLIISDYRELTHTPRAWRRSFEYVLNDQELARAHAQAALPHSEFVQIEMADHIAFADQYFNPSHFRMWLKIDPLSVHDAVRSRLSSFFGAYLPQASNDATQSAASQTVRAP